MALGVNYTSELFSLAAGAGLFGFFIRLPRGPRGEPPGGGGSTQILRGKVAPLCQEQCSKRESPMNHWQPAPRAAGKGLVAKDGGWRGHLSGVCPSQ